MRKIGSIYSVLIVLGYETIVIMSNRTNNLVNYLLVRQFPKIDIPSLLCILFLIGIVISTKHKSNKEFI